MRWLPVIFTIGTLYFSATSAIFRNFTQVLLRKRQALAKHFLGLFFKLRSDGLEQRLAHPGAASASRRSARALLQLGQRVDALLVNRRNDRALGHAQAPADCFAI